MQSKRLPSLIILLILLTTSCSTPPSSNQNGSNQSTSIEIQITGTESKELGIETIPQPNCTGSAEVENTVEKSRTIEYVMEVQNGVSVNANGQVGFAGTDIELGATVASQFGQSYGTSETLTRSITVKAKPSTDMQHVIRQVEIWKVGQAKISVGGQQTIIPFKYRYDFAIEYAGNNQIPCDTNGTTNIIPSNTQPIPQPTIAQVATQSGNLIHNESVSPETLARIVGGNAAYWTQAGAVVWVYANKNNNTTIRHPGENMVLTYWAGFGDPQNASDCQIIISPVNSLEKAVKCPSGTNAQIIADQVGLHLIDYTGFFP